MEGLVSRETLAARVRAVRPSGIRKFFDIAATMPDVISLGVGEPDFVTPEHIRQAGIRSRYSNSADGRSCCPRKSRKRTW